MTKTNIDNRLKKLETRLVDDSGEETAIFFVTVSARKNAPPPEPILGYKYKNHEIIRKPGESDDDLQLRAREKVRPFLRDGEAPCFFAIQNQEEKTYE
jgi:hypothetical protein